MALFRGLDVAMSFAEALTTLGRIVRARDDAERARTVLAEALGLAWTRGSRWVVAAALEERAALAITQEQAPLASQICGAVATLRASMHAPSPATSRGHAGTVAAAHAALGDDDLPGPGTWGKRSHSSTSSWQR